MSEILQLKLKQNFREPLTSQIGFFGRKAELSRLIALFKRRPSATVLVSGHRGVGKTALVEEALNRAKGAKRKLVIARLTLPHLYESGRPSLREQVLRGLARALYFALKNEHVPKATMERANSLYAKTYLKELTEETVIGSIVRGETKQLSRVQTETIVRPDKMITAAFGTILAGGVAIAGVWAVAGVATTFGRPWGIAAAFVVVGAMIASAITFSKLHTDEKTVVDELTGKHKKTQVGKYDLSPETLEFELRNLIEELAKAKRPCVFVIDELDKLEVAPDDNTGQGLENHVIFRIVAALKNFFTLGAGIYVFIAGEDFYARLSESMDSGEYLLAHTMFTDRLFLHALHYRATEQLIDGLMESKPKDDLAYRQFKNYLCWKSRNHVFDLLSSVEEFATYEDGGAPTLIAREEGEVDGQWKIGNLPKDWRTIAGLQKFVGAAYDESRRPPSAQGERFNQALWFTLLDTLKMLYERESIDVEEGEYTVPEGKWVIGLGKRDTDDLSGAVERLLAKLERFGTVVLDETTMTVTEENTEQDVPVTRYWLVEEPPYPPSSVAAESQLIPIEQSFIDLTKRVTTIANNVRSAGINVDQFETELREVEKLAAQVRNTSSRMSVPRSQTREGLQKADRIAEGLVEAGLDGALRRWAQDGELGVGRNVAEVEARTGAPWRASLGEFAELVEELEQGEYEYYIFGETGSENQLLVIPNWENEDLSDLSGAYAKALPGEKGRERRKQRLPLLIVNHAVADNIAEIPEEVVEEIEVESKKTFSRYWWSRPPKTKKTRKELAGWNVFSVETDLANIEQLKAQMTDMSYFGLDRETA